MRFCLGHYFTMIMSIMIVFIKSVYVFKPVVVFLRFSFVTELLELTPAFYRRSFRFFGYNKHEHFDNSYSVSRPLYQS